MRTNICNKAESTSVLNEPPKPTIGWNMAESSTTISALPMGPGAAKLIGGEGARDVKSLLRSRVVCH